MTRLLCSDWARNNGVLAAGTATPAEGWLLVDWPLPWPSQIEQIEELREVFEEAADRGIRVQLAVPDATCDLRRVSLFDLSPQRDFFRRYRTAQRQTSQSRVVEAALVLLRADQDPDDEDSITGPLGRIVLLCTHGNRDSCCGSRGAGLYGALPTSDALLRSSHLGGHRFAPTALLLPEGTMWAFLDADTADQVLNRNGSVASIAHLFRGCCAFSSEQVQVVDAYLFSLFGWEWLEWYRRGRFVGDGTVVFEAIDPSGNPRAWRATVRVRRLTPVPLCPVDDAEHPTAEKMTPEYVIDTIEELAEGELSELGAEVTRSEPTGPRRREDRQQ
jgi:hypothetical protein